MQVPPMYSALKRKGKRLYELARKGVEVEREARPMTVHNIRLSKWIPPVASISVECGRGFYMRSLAHDIGVRLGCGAHLQSLTRIRAGRFHIEDSIGLESALRCFEDGSWTDALHRPDYVLGDMKAAIVGTQGQKHIQNGRPVALDTPLGDELCRAYGVDGEFLAILRFDPTDDVWRPDKVFSSQTTGS